MKKKPTYEELEQKIKELECLESIRKKNGNALGRFFNLSVDMLCIADMKGYFRLVNDSFEKILGYSKNELCEQSYTHFVHPDDLDSTISVVEQLVEGNPITKFENRYRCKDGSYKWLSWTSMPIIEKGINYSVARDISCIKQAEAVLRQAHDELEQQVKNRTIELTSQTKVLEETNSLLKKSKLELAGKNQSLEELNTALKVLIQQKDNNQLELEEKILATMKILVEPYLEKLNGICPEHRQQNFIRIIKTNLQNILSSFSKKMSSMYVNLTAAEIQVADFIRNSQGNKEIAQMLNISPETVAFHRKSMRKKLGITNTKKNLAEYLKTLT